MFNYQGRDAETGLDYFGARYTSSAQARLNITRPTINGSVCG